MDAGAGYSIKGIHLPENVVLILRIKKMALAISAVVIALSLLSLGGWLGEVPAGVAVGFILAAVPLLIRLSSKTPQRLQFWGRAITMGCGVAVVAGSLFGVSATNFGLFLLGWVLVLIRTKMGVRFRLMQLSAGIVIMMGLATVIATVYSYLLPAPRMGMAVMPVNIAILFTLLGEAFLLRWPNRGFMGLFNTESLTSGFAFRLLILNMLITPLVGGVGVIIARMMTLALYEAAALVVTMQMGVFVMIMWLGVRRLYEWELRRYLDYEQVRINHTGLKVSNEEMKVKMAELEEARDRYLSTLKQMNSMGSLAEYFD